MNRSRNAHRHRRQLFLSLASLVSLSFFPPLAKPADLSPWDHLAKVDFLPDPSPVIGLLSGKRMRWEKKEKEAAAVMPGRDRGAVPMARYESKNLSLRLSLSLLEP